MYTVIQGSPGIARHSNKQVLNKLVIMIIGMLAVSKQRLAFGEKIVDVLSN